MCDHPRQLVPWAPWKALPCAWPDCTKGGRCIAVIRMPNQPILWHAPPQDLMASNYTQVIFERRTWFDRYDQREIHEWVRRE